MESNLTDAQYKQVRTTAFKKWFGDWEKTPEKASKVIDENGEPLVVYHGTNFQFDFFDEEKIKESSYWGDGFYFTDHLHNAKHHGTNILEVFLSLKNPYILDNGKHFKELEKLLEVETDYTEETVEGVFDGWAKYVLGYRSELSQKEIRTKLEVAGYDGIVIDQNNKSIHIAFYSNQIKSANNNNGEFSLKKNNINL